MSLPLRMCFHPRPVLAKLPGSNDKVPRHLWDTAPPFSCQDPSGPASILLFLQYQSPSLLLVPNNLSRKLFLEPIKEMSGELPLPVRVEAKKLGLSTMCGVGFSVPLSRALWAESPAPIKVRSPDTRAVWEGGFNFLRLWGMSSDF